MSGRRASRPQAAVERLQRVLERGKRRVVGLMSGTSVDAVDAVLVELERQGERLHSRQLGFVSLPFPPSLRERLFVLFDPERARLEALCELDFVLGEVFAQAVLRLLEGCGLRPSQVDLVGTAGQTVWHAPQLTRLEAEVDWLREPVATRATLAIGQSAVIAQRTGILTIGDLRVRDVAAGGHGAPLVAYADWALLRRADRGRCVQNIGGIANVTWLPPGASLEAVVAFDTGPGNMVIDAMVERMTQGRERFDRDGRIAASHAVDEALLARWLADPWFDQAPPRTTGREAWGRQFAERVAQAAAGVAPGTLVATATALTARSIAQAYRRFLPSEQIDEVILGGGGARNATLVRWLAQALPGCRILRHEDVGLDSQAKEALAIAIIANDALDGLPTNVPGATGGRPAVLGKLCL